MPPTEVAETPIPN